MMKMRSRAQSIRIWFAELHVSAADIAKEQNLTAKADEGVHDALNGDKTLMRLSKITKDLKGVAPGGLEKTIRLKPG